MSTETDRDLVKRFKAFYDEICADLEIWADLEPDDETLNAAGLAVYTAKLFYDEVGGPAMTAAFFSAAAALSTKEAAKQQTNH
jgi:hypothetical protein